MGRAGLRAALLAEMLPLAAASTAAAAAPWASAAGAPAEVEGQQECEHAAMHVEALQRGSALASGATAQRRRRSNVEEKIEVEGNPYVMGPNLYLSSLVDEGNYRGYCLDIAGSPPHPYCASLQGHSCKEEGEDTQFFYDIHTQQVRSLNFNGACNPLYDGESAIDDTKWSADTGNTEPACVTVKGEYAPGSSFAIAPCDAFGKQDSQRFAYTSSGHLRVGSGYLCLVLSANVTDIYKDFYLRGAELQPCDTWPAELSTWEALLGDHTKLRLPGADGEASARRTWPADSSRLP